MRPLLTAGLILLVGGCASMGNTLAQDLAWERWNKCNDGSIRLLRIDRDGRVWTQATSDSAAALPRWQTCMQEALTQQGKRVATAPAPAVATAPAAGIVPVPEWKRGDEWAFRWESPRGSGTFVWSMDREEVMDGVPVYVVTTGARELFYRKSDLAIHLDRLSGEVETRYAPARPLFSWPLTPGKAWETSYVRHRPKDRQTSDHVEACRVTGDETTTVPAGTFQAVKIECRQQKDKTAWIDLWYAPAVKQNVRERGTRDGGIMERELIAYKVK